jgi:hypothetical protein
VQSPAGVSWIGNVSSDLNRTLANSRRSASKYKRTAAGSPRGITPRGPTFCRQRPAHVINIKIQGLGHLCHVLAGLDVFPKCLSVDFVDRWLAEAYIRRHGSLGI